jgi:truncated hemoglobin YjbI
MNPDRACHVAAFLADVLGGPAEYSQQHGGHAQMIRQHLARHLIHTQRRAWIALFVKLTRCHHRLVLGSGSGTFMPACSGS